MKTDWEIERSNFELAMMMYGIKREELKKDEHGNYLHSGVNSTWTGWQKSAKGEKKI